MSREAPDMVLLAVGCGAFLIPDKLEAVSEVVRVPHGDPRNAVGAATAQISGKTDQVFRGISREEALAAAQRIAAERAQAAEANTATLTTVDAEGIAIAYLAGNARRVCNVGELLVK